MQLGYNSAKQNATKLSPMQVLFGRDPTIPPATRERMEEELPCAGTDMESLAALMVRADSIKRMGIIVGDNLKVAQHRDTLRYATRRAGDYTPLLRKFQENDFVYVRAHAASRRNLDSHVHQTVRRVLRVGVAGTLKVQGPDGEVTIIHACNAAPCHTPKIPWEISSTTIKQGHLHQACMGCNHSDFHDTMLLCDACGQAWHASCLHAPLGSMPSKNTSWRCESCVANNIPAQKWTGVTPSSLPRRSAAARRKALDDDRLNGRFVLIPFSGTKWWGIVRCQGAARDCLNSENLFVNFSDGDQGTYNKASILKYLLPASTV